MNKQIFEQLKKCKVASLPDFDMTTLCLNLQRQDKPKESELQLDHYYIITVEDYIIHPFDGFTLHANWNHDIAPTDKDMKVEILQMMGKMIKVEAIGVNDGKSWCGWLPMKSINIQEELK